MTEEEFIKYSKEHYLIDEYEDGLRTGIKWGQNNPTLDTIRDILQTYIELENISEDGTINLEELLKKFKNKRETLELF